MAAPVVFGTHEEKTIAQLRDVASRAERVALMADGHLGYVMPIGGVAAYRNQVSVVGVGFDIACLTGDTRVFTLDGKTPTLQELSERGEEVWVLSCESNGKPRPSRATCQKTRTDAEIMSVTLDNGSEIRCTPDHLFLMRDGAYQRADCLASGDRLMPFYRCKNKDSYVLVRNNATGNLLYLHWLVFHAGLLDPEPTLDDGDELVIHHKNFVRNDNRPDNLAPVSRRAHDAMHARMRDRAHWNSPSFTKKRIAAIKKFWRAARADDEFMARRRATAAANSRRGVRDHRDSYRDNGRRGRQYLIRYNTSPPARQRLKARANRPLPCPLCSAVVKLATCSLWYHAKHEHPDALRVGTELLKGQRRITTAQRLIAGANNHVVTEARLLPERQDTYCLCVPGLNNFALASGVFVHNCGNAAIRSDRRLDHYTRTDLELVADEIQRTISFGMGRTNRADDAPTDHPLFEHPAWGALPGKHERDGLLAKARSQLGTVGGGNHYVDVFADENRDVWVGVHFGSRGFGHTVASGFLALSQGKRWGQRVPEVEALLPLAQPLGHDYWQLMTLAGQYAYAGREWVARKVVAILGGEERELVHNHHNFAWKETHAGTDYVVVRKGATPAFPGQKGFVGGSMGDDAVIVEGAHQDSERQRAALYSTVHGAGRVMSRTAARGKVNRKTGELITPGKVTWQMLRHWVGEKGVILRGGGLDESPHAYRRLPDVLAAQGDTITVLHTLTPLIVVMAGENEFDPYRD
jgi:tRNA-splicing ligase RtcB